VRSEISAGRRLAGFMRAGLWRNHRGGIAVLLWGECGLSSAALITGAVCVCVCYCQRVQAPVNATPDAMMMMMMMILMMITGTVMTACKTRRQSSASIPLYDVIMTSFSDLLGDWLRTVSIRRS